MLRGELAPGSYLWPIKEQHLSEENVREETNRGQEKLTGGTGTMAKASSANNVLLQLYPRVLSICCVNSGNAAPMMLPKLIFVSDVSFGGEIH